MSTRVLALIVVVLAACTPAPQPPVPVTRDVLVGTWRHELPNREIYELMLFDSGIVGFIHAGEKLPISQAYGRWSFDEGTLDLHIVGGNPDTAEFPLANRIIVQRDSTKLLFDIDGTRRGWTPYARYGTTADASERAASDEKSWTTQVEAAEKTEAGEP